MSDLRTIQQQVAGALLAVGMPRLGYLRGDALADSIRRLAVYHHGYRVRMREALATEFPGLALLTGRRFARLLDSYIASNPSTHFNIRWHGQRLASYLATTQPWRDRAELAEVAQLDWAISTAFDAADYPIVDAEGLAGIPPQSWGGIRLHPLPHARLLRLSTNVDAFRRASDRGQPRPALRRLQKARYILIWRPAQEVRYRQLFAAELPALQAALDGATLAELCQHLADRQGAEPAMAHMAALLGQWIADGLIARVTVPGRR